MNDYTRRRKIVDDIVMPFDVMVKNENLKKIYDMSVMMVNMDKSIYYDTVGFATKRLIQTYDTDSDDDEDISVSGEAKAEKPNPTRRHWCISCDTVWKNLRVSKSNEFNCYYSINPFTYEYELDTEENINGFMKSFEHNKVPLAIEKEIVANYNYSLRVERNIES